MDAVPLAFAILISGLDDLVIDAAWAFSWLRGVWKPEARMFPPGPRQLEAAPQRTIAILVPLWHEHEVIARMLEHNLASIRYADYHFFAGAYPNDDLNAGRRALGRGPVSERPPGAVPPRRTRPRKPTASTGFISA